MKATVPSGHDTWLLVMRAVQITRFGGPEVMDVVDLPDPVAGAGEQLFDISSSGVISARPVRPLTAGRHPSVGVR